MKKGDKDVLEPVFIPPTPDSLPGFDVEVFLIADGSKIELVGGEWMRVMTAVGDPVEKNDPTYSVIKTAAQKEAAEAEQEQAEATAAEEAGEDVSAKKSKKRKKMKGLSLKKNDEEEMKASELWEAYSKGIRVKVKSRGRAAYEKQLEQLDEALHQWSVCCAAALRRTI